MYQQPSPSTGASTVPEATSSAVPATSSPAPAPSASSAQLLPPQINVAASAASLPSASTCAPAPVAPAPGPSPNGMTTSYGMVVWPSLPGLQQAAVGVAPPQPSPQAMVGGHSGGVMGRGILGPMTSGRGGIPMRVGVGGLVMSGAASAAGSPGLDVGREDESETEKAQQRKQLASRKESSRSQQPPEAASDRESLVVLRNACDACHRMKRKCDGLQPCNRCRRRSRPCGYSYKQKSGPPKGSKRKLIAADEDLLENRQGRPKLLPLAMWPKDAEEERMTNAAVAANAHRINQLIAVSTQTPPAQKPPQPPRLPGISIPPEGRASNGAGAAAAAAAVAAASAVNNAGCSPRPESTSNATLGSLEQTNSSSNSNAAAAAAAVAAAVAAATANAAANAKAAAANAAHEVNAANAATKAASDAQELDDRHAVNRLALPPEAAQLSLEARAGAYKRAQEAAAAGMAAAKAFVEDGYRKDDKDETTAANGAGVAPTTSTTVEQSPHQKQGVLGRLVSTSAPTEAKAMPLPLASVATFQPTTTGNLASPHENPAPSVAMLPLNFSPPRGTSAAGQPSSSPAAAAAAPGVTAAPSATTRSAGSPSNAGQVAHPGMAAGGLPLPSGMPPGMPHMGMTMAYHPQYGVYQPYPQSLYAAYLAQYQLQHGLNPYDGIPLYDGINPYLNAVYGHVGAPGVAVGTPGVEAGQAQQGLAGVTAACPPLSVTAAAAAAIAAATQNAAAAGGEKAQPKESEEAKQLAVETLLGLKNSQGSKGDAPDEASAQAMAAVTAAAVSAAAAAAEESVAHGTIAGTEHGSTASAAAAAAAATAKAVAEAVAAAGGLSTQMSPDQGSLNLPLVGEGKDTAGAATLLAESKQTLAAANGTEVTMLPSGGTIYVGAVQAPVETEAKEVPKDDASGNNGHVVASNSAALARVEGGAEVLSPQQWAPLHGGPEEASAGRRGEAAGGEVATAVRVASVAEPVRGEGSTETPLSAVPAEARLPVAGAGAKVGHDAVTSAEPRAPAAATAESGISAAPHQTPRTIVSTV